MRLLLSMGVHPQGASDSAREPRLVELDWESGEPVRERTWVAGHCAGPDEHCEFTGAHVHDGLLWQTTRNELLWMRPSDLEVVDSFSHPLFYDVHDAVAYKGGFAVSCAGHESVLVFNGDRELVRHVWLRGDGFDAHYGGVGDWRAHATEATKPHSHHPNNLFVRRGELWVTVFEQGVAVNLDGPGRVELPEGPPHDGRARNGLIWFTTVSGHVIAVDADTLERRVALDLNAMSDSRRMLGWCRGVEVIGDRLFVGMSMLRQSRHREVLRRAFRGESGVKLPTRVIEVDLAAGRIVEEVVVGNEAGGTIYSINAVASQG